MQYTNTQATLLIQIPKLKQLKSQLNKQHNSIQNTTKLKQPKQTQHNNKLQHSTKFKTTQTNNSQPE